MEITSEVDRPAAGLIWGLGFAQLGLKGYQRYCGGNRSNEQPLGSSWIKIRRGLQVRKKMKGLRSWLLISVRLKNRDIKAMKPVKELRSKL